jgi:hypothetical protein
MQNIDWKNYRHPKFLQSLDMTLKELKYLNLFLIKDKSNNSGTLRNLRQTRLVTVKNGLESSKNFAKEKVGIDI